MLIVSKLKEVDTSAIIPKIPYPECTGFAVTATKSVKLKRIESEEHVLQGCPLYYKSRMEFQTKCRNVINASNRGTTKTARDDDDQNSHNKIIFFLSNFCHKIFKFRKAFLDYLDGYAD